jgi:hypothetical protein
MNAKYRGSQILPSVYPALREIGAGFTALLIKQLPQSNVAQFWCFHPPPPPLSAHVPDNLGEEPLEHPCRVVQSLPLPRGRDNLQLFPRRELLLKLVVHLRRELN